MLAAQLGRGDRRSAGIKFSSKYKNHNGRT